MWLRRFHEKSSQKSSKTGIMANFKNITSFAVCNIIQSSLAFLVGDWSALSTQMQRILISVRFPCGERKMAPFEQRREFNPIGPIFKTSQLFYFLTWSRQL
jgi:hypothetical protein